MKVCWVGVLDFSACVVIPGSFTLLCDEIGRMQNFALSCVLLGSKFDFELSKFGLVADSAKNISYSFESVSGVADLIFLQVFHLSSVRRKVLW